MNPLPSSRRCLPSSRSPLTSAADDASIQLSQISFFSRPTSPVLGKILVIVFCRFSDFHTRFYAVDLNHSHDRAIPSLEPVRYLDDKWPLAMAFVVRDNTVYMFGGKFLGNSSWESDFFTFKFSTSVVDSPPALLLREHVRKRGTMLSRKVGPMAVVIRDKICVFSSSPQILTSPNCEVYDLSANSWFSIPAPFDKPSSDNYQIFSSHVKDDSVLYLSTTDGVYSVDFNLSPLDMTWKLDSIPVPPPPSRMRGPVIDNYLFFPHYGYDLESDDPTTPKYHFLPTDDWRSNLIDAYTKGDLVFMGQGTLGELKFCTVRVGLKDFEAIDQVPHLMVDVFYCFKSRSRQLKIIQKKNFSFALTENRCEDVCTVVAFILKEKK